MSRETEEKYSGIVELVEAIQIQYNEINKQWERESILPNLKKNQVRDIEGKQSDIYVAIVKYRELLNDRVLGIEQKIAEQSSIGFTCRVKNLNSIEYKIDNYMKHHENGKVPLNKCLNDLLGFRVVVDSFCIDEFHSISAISAYKVIDSSKILSDKYAYRASHVYFQVNNRFFPWELQIWENAFAETNLKSHEHYKQDYVNWERKTKEH